MDIDSDDIICNTGFIQPVSDVVASVPAGGVVSAEFHHTSAGYIGPDPSDPLDPTDKGQSLHLRVLATCCAYLVRL